MEYNKYSCWTAEVNKFGWPLVRLFFQNRYLGHHSLTTFRRFFESKITLKVHKHEIFLAWSSDFYFI
jgi:hypothetical protein